MKHSRPNECRSQLPLPFLPFFFFFFYMNISGEVALNPDAWWYCNRITESSLEGFLPASKASSSACRANSLGGLWGRLCLISISKPLHCQLSEAAFPPVCARVNVWNVWGWHHPPWVSEVDCVKKESCTKRAWFLQRVFSISLIALLQKSCTLSVHHKGASSVRQSPWEAFMCRIQFKIPSLSVKLCFIFFPLAPDVIWIPYVKLFCICYAHRGDTLYALLPDCSIIHYSPHWLLNMKHALSIKPLLSPGQWSVAGVPEFFQDKKRGRLYGFKQRF